MSATRTQREHVIWHDLECGGYQDDLLPDPPLRWIAEKGIRHGLEFSTQFEANLGAGSGKVRGWPTRDEMSYPIDEQLIVELYSK